MTFSMTAVVMLVISPIIFQKSIAHVANATKLFLWFTHNLDTVWLKKPFHLDDRHEKSFQTTVWEVLLLTVAHSEG